MGYSPRGHSESDMIEATEHAHTGARSWAQKGHGEEAEGRRSYRECREEEPQAVRRRGKPGEVLMLRKPRVTDLRK